MPDVTVCVGDLVHTALSPETKTYFGCLDCGQRYTEDPRLVDEYKVLGHKTWRTPTCVACIARLLR